MERGAHFVRVLSEPIGTIRRCERPRPSMRESIEQRVVQVSKKIIHLKRGSRSPSIKITGERVLCHTTNVSIHRWGREVAVSLGHDKSTGYNISGREIAIETNRNES